MYIINYKCTVFLALAWQSRHLLLHTGVSSCCVSSLACAVAAHLKGEGSGDGGGVVVDEIGASHLPQWPEPR